MNLFFQNKSYLFLLGGILVVVIFLLILAFSLLRAGTPVTPPSETPSPASSLTTPQPSEFDPYSEAYKKSTKKIIQEEKVAIEQDQKVAGLLQKLPFQGSYFTAKYDIGTNVVTVTITPTQNNAGENEFAAFLLENGIQDKSLLPNLKVRYQNTNSPID
jgi:multidrug efflux pump subunit AcrB